METLFEELKRYVRWSDADEAALRALAPRAEPELERISSHFYARILDHHDARKALVEGESQVGRLKITLKAWMQTLLSGPWDEAYYQRRARIGRVHVQIALPQHYMLAAMNVIREELLVLAPEHVTRTALSKILDMELAIMLHTYREDLIAAKAKSERLATFGQLVGSIGHELRNPLGVIESSLYILKGRLDDERAKKHAARIGEQVQLANRIVADLLDMIRDRPLDLGQVQLGAIVDDVIGTAKHALGVRITADGFAALPPIQADASKLRQALLNLVENAADAAAPDGEVRVHGEVSGGTLVLSVEDTGPGVDPSIRARLFEPLITTKSKGIGLGLPLVRRVVERHGGTVAYVPPPSGGARFEIRLPLHA
jgi:signal transduction histidine kinase